MSSASFALRFCRFALSALVFKRLTSKDRTSFFATCLQAVLSVSGLRGWGIMGFGVGCTHPIVPMFALIKLIKSYIVTGPVLCWLNPFQSWRPVRDDFGDSDYLV